MAEPSEKKIAVLAGAALLVSALGAGLYHLTQQKSAPRAIAGFDIQQVEARTPAASQGDYRPAGPVDSTEFLSRAAGGAADSEAVSAQRVREKEFISKYDGLIRKYQDYLNGIGMRYRERYPIVREVDEAFGRLDRYMAVRRRYERDRDLYQWARDTAALPEVRATVRKYLKRPEAWSVAVDMTIEALKVPPPTPVYKEVLRTLGTDPAIIDFSNDLANGVKDNLNVAVPALVGKDITPLQPLLKDVSAPINKQR